MENNQSYRINNQHPYKINEKISKHTIPNFFSGSIFIIILMGIVCGDLGIAFSFIGIGIVCTAGIGGILLYFIAINLGYSINGLIFGYNSTAVSRTIKTLSNPTSNQQESLNQYISKLYNSTGIKQEIIANLKSKGWNRLEIEKAIEFAKTNSSNIH